MFRRRTTRAAADDELLSANRELGGSSMRKLHRTGLALAATVMMTSGAALSMAAPASAAANDDFSISTTNGCGAVNFIDYGPGAPGGGNNDDYLVIHDYCADGHGVRAWAWLNDPNTPIGTEYNGNGESGAPVIWDPFKAHGNVDAGDQIKLEVCLVDGVGSTNFWGCRVIASISVDG
jgi:hypothetical protein